MVPWKRRRLAGFFYPCGWRGRRRSQDSARLPPADGASRALDEPLVC